MFYSFLRNCARLFYIIVYHIHVIGGENIPKEKGGYIIASNHVSNNDPPVVGITFKGKYTFMAKEELFEINPIFSVLISKLGAFPVRRGAKDNTAIEKALESLGEGRIFVIFPEGTRTTAGVPPHLKHGAAAAALASRHDITPVRITCDPPAQMKGIHWYTLPPRRMQISVTVCDSIPIGPFLAVEAAEGRPKAVRRLNEALAAQLFPINSDYRHEYRCTY